MRLLIFPTLLLLFFSCNSNKDQSSTSKTDTVSPQALKKFYYPLEELSEDGLVYVYIDDSVKAPADYWLFKTVKDEAGNLFLIGNSYDAKLEQRYFSREWIVANGIILKDYHFIQTDSLSGKSIVRPAKIDENVVFPFNPTNDSSMAYRFRIKFSLLPDTAMNFDLVRDRKFERYTEYEYRDTKLKAVEFSAKEYIEAKDSINGGYWTINSEMKEIYAEGIGLVYIEKKGPGANFRYRLEKRISPDEFLKLSDSKNKQ